MKQQGQNTRRQFAGFEETKVNDFRVWPINCPLKDQDRNCLIYNRECIYPNRYHCPHYVDYCRNSKDIQGERK